MFGAATISSTVWAHDTMMEHAPSPHLLLQVNQTQNHYCQSSNGMDLLCQVDIVVSDPAKSSTNDTLSVFVKTLVECKSQGLWTEWDPTNCHCTVLSAIDKSLGRRAKRNCTCAVCSWRGFGDNPIAVECLLLVGDDDWLIGNCSRMDCNYACKCGPCITDCQASGPACRFCPAVHDSEEQDASLPQEDDEDGLLPDDDNGEEEENSTTTIRTGMVMRLIICGLAVQMLLVVLIRHLCRLRKRGRHSTVTAGANAIRRPGRSAATAGMRREGSVATSSQSTLSLNDDDSQDEGGAVSSFCGACPCETSA